MLGYIKAFAYIVCIGLFIGLGNAYAADSVLVMTEQFPPFNYKDGGEIKGFSTKIVRKLTEHARLNYTIELVPWKRAYNTTLSRPNTLIYTIAKTDARMDKFHWIGKISNRKVSLFRLRSRKDLAAMTLEQAKEKARIATVQGDASTEKIISMGFVPKNLNVIRDSTAGSLAINHVILERSDYFPMNPYSLKHRIETGEVPDLFANQFVIWDADGYYIAANIDTAPQVLEALRTAYTRLSQEGFVDKVVDSYLAF